MHVSIFTLVYSPTTVATTATPTTSSNQFCCMLSINLLYVKHYTQGHTLDLAAASVSACSAITD